MFQSSWLSVSSPMYFNFEGRKLNVFQWLERWSHILNMIWLFTARPSKGREFESHRGQRINFFIFVISII